MRIPQDDHHESIQELFPIGPDETDIELSNAARAVTRNCPKCQNKYSFYTLRCAICNIVLWKPTKEELNLFEYFYRTIWFNYDSIQTAAMETLDKEDFDKMFNNHVTRIGRTDLIKKQKDDTLSDFRTMVKELPVTQLILLRKKIEITPEAFDANFLAIVEREIQVKSQ